jgi:hypothetical protein
VFEVVFDIGVTPELFAAASSAGFAIEAEIVIEETEVVIEAGAVSAVVMREHLGSWACHLSCWALDQWSQGW